MILSKMPTSMIVFGGMLFAILSGIVCGLQPQQPRQPRQQRPTGVGRRAALTTFFSTTTMAVSQLLPLPLPASAASTTSTTPCVVCGTYEDDSNLRYVISLQPNTMFMGNKVANIVVKGSGRGRTVLPALIKNENIVVDLTLLDGHDEIKGVFDSKDGVIRFAKGNRRWVKIVKDDEV